MTRTDNKRDHATSDKTDHRIEQQQGEPPMINMRGEKVGLGPERRDLLPLINRWENDFAVQVLAGDPPWPYPREAAEAEYDRRSKAEGPRNWAGFVIYELASLRPIGVTDLRHIDGTRRTAEFGVMIGEQDCWGKGYGTEAVILMLAYGFDVLGLHNILLETNGFNERAIRAYTRAGFREIGRRREAQRLNGRVYDIVLMDCLATEFHNPYRPVIELPTWRQDR